MNCDDVLISPAKAQLFPEAKESRSTPAWLKAVTATRPEKCSVSWFVSWFVPWFAPWFVPWFAFKPSVAPSLASAWTALLDLPKLRLGEVGAPRTP